MSHRTTPKHFKTFERAVRVALHDLGVNDWQAFIEHSDLKSAGLANCTTRSLSRTATVRLGKRWNVPVTDSELTDTARHEALHVALGALSAVAASRCITQDELDAVEEATVQRFLRCVRWSGK